MDNRPILENKDADPVWALLHRAYLDNIHIEMCYEDVSRILKLSELDRDREEVREALASCGLPKIPLDKVMGVIFPLVSFHLMEIYEVRYQPKPRSVEKTRMITTDLDQAIKAKLRERKARIITWEDGKIIKVEKVKG